MYGLTRALCSLSAGLVTVARSCAAVEAGVALSHQTTSLQKGGTSQLALLTEESYAAGLERIKADLRQADSRGEALEFVVDISLALVTGRTPYAQARTQQQAVLPRWPTVA